MSITSAEAQAQNAKVLAVQSANLAALAAVTANGSAEALEKIAIKAVNEIKSMLSRPGTGAVYQHGNVTHQASAPGEPPAVDTGTYRNSWAWVSAGKGSSFYVDIGTPQVTGPILEFGSSRMAPRPHLRPAMEQVRATMQREIVEQVTKAQLSAIKKMQKFL